MHSNGSRNSFDAERKNFARFALVPNEWMNVTSSFADDTRAYVFDLNQFKPISAVSAKNSELNYFHSKCENVNSFHRLLRKSQITMKPYHKRILIHECGQN